MKRPHMGEGYHTRLQSEDRRRRAINRRKEIYEELRPETKAGVAGANARCNGKDATDNLSAAFATETAKATGKAERTIRLTAARGKALGDSLDDIEGTSLDKKAK